MPGKPSPEFLLSGKHQISKLKKTPWGCIENQSQSSHDFHHYPNLFIMGECEMPDEVPVR